ncbi:MAG: hypothetical protein AAF974_07975, partial [Cyanobacteria bacterium P01_E01_bin.34]
WADDQIACCEAPSYDLIDLSLMEKSHPLDVLGVLGCLSGNVGQLDVLPAVLTDAYELLANDRKFDPTLARGLRALFADCGYDVTVEFRPVAWLDEYYELARLGLLGTEEEAYQELLSFAASFRGTTTADSNI